MGIVVFLEVNVKIFFIVSVEVCVECCYSQLKDKGMDVNIVCFLIDIKVRDECDI